MPKANLVGSVHNGWAVMMGQLENERMGLCPVAPVGLGEYSTIRWPTPTPTSNFGRPIGAFQAVTHMIAEMNVLSHTCELVTPQLAGLIGADRPARMEASIGKVHCAGLGS